MTPNPNPSPEFTAAGLKEAGEHLNEWATNYGADHDDDYIAKEDVLQYIIRLPFGSPQTLPAPGEETWTSIARWCEETFGPVTMARTAERANEEMQELLAEPENVIEAADVCIVLSRYPGLWDAVQRKMAINRARTWDVRGDGTGYHVKAEGSSVTPEKPLATVAAANDEGVAESRAEALLPYTSHAIGCAIYQRSWGGGAPECTCGLEEARDAVLPAKGGQ